MLFVTQPKLQIMCLHVLRQLHRLLLVWGQMVNVMAIAVVPVSLPLSKCVVCVQCAAVCVCVVSCVVALCVCGRSVCVGVLWPCASESVLCVFVYVWFLYGVARRKPPSLDSKLLRVCGQNAPVHSLSRACAVVGTCATVSRSPLGALMSSKS